MKNKPKAKRTNSSTGKVSSKRLQKAETKSITKTVKYGANSGKAKRANKKVARIKKRY